MKEVLERLLEATAVWIEQNKLAKTQLWAKNLSTNTAFKHANYKYENLIIAVFLLFPSFVSCLEYYIVLTLDYYYFVTLLLVVKILWKTSPCAKEMFLYKIEFVYLSIIL